jgi:mRNA interferase MazF
MGDPQRGEFYYANLIPVEGSEQGGIRPVLIISNNIMNRVSPITVVIPLTSQVKARSGPFNIPYEITKVTLDEDGIKLLNSKGYYYKNENGTILCNHARSISKTRLIGRIGSLNDLSILLQVEEALKDTFSIDGCLECGLPLRKDALICAKCGKIVKIKCIVCGHAMGLKYNHCPMCGKVMKHE